MENIGLGLILMVVGMATVFVILLIVIFLGKYLITLVNKFAPPEETHKPQKPVNGDADVMSAIKIAVDKITNGKGQVVKIEKI